MRSGQGQNTQSQGLGQITQGQVKVKADHTRSGQSQARSQGQSSSEVQAWSSISSNMLRVHLPLSWYLWSVGLPWKQDKQSNIVRNTKCQTLYILGLKLTKIEQYLSAFTWRKSKVFQGFWKPTLCKSQKMSLHSLPAQRYDISWRLVSTDKTAGSQHPVPSTVTISMKPQWELMSFWRLFFNRASWQTSSTQLKTPNMRTRCTVEIIILPSSLSVFFLSSTLIFGMRKISWKERVGRTN